MTCLLKHVCSVAGVICILGAIGTSDFYTIELHQPVPANVGTTLLVGVLLLIPGIISFMKGTYHENHL